MLFPHRPACDPGGSSSAALQAPAFCQRISCRWLMFFHYRRRSTSLRFDVHHDWLLRNGLFSEIMSVPLHDQPYSGVVLCPFGLPAGMHAEAAWNTVKCSRSQRVGSLFAKHV